MTHEEYLKGLLKHLNDKKDDGEFDKYVILIRNTIEEFVEQCLDGLKNNYFDLVISETLNLIKNYNADKKDFVTKIGFDILEMHIHQLKLIGEMNNERNDVQ